jgi:hypothetical protein
MLCISRAARVKLLALERRLAKCESRAMRDARPLFLHHAGGGFNIDPADFVWRVRDNVPVKRV